MNEAKLVTALDGKEFRPMQEEEIQRIFMSPAGYLGPVKVPALAAGAQQLGSGPVAAGTGAQPLVQLHRAGLLKDVDDRMAVAAYAQRRSCL